MFSARKQCNVKFLGVSERETYMEDLQSPHLKQIKYKVNAVYKRI